MWIYNSLNNSNIHNIHKSTDKIKNLSFHVPALQSASSELVVQPNRVHAYCVFLENGTQKMQQC